MSLLVVGSLNIDKTMDVPVFAETGQTLIGGNPTENLGGKGGNQAMAAKKSMDGISVIFAGAVGHDTDGHFYRSELANRGIDLSQLQTAEGHTGVAIILTSQGQNRIQVAGKTDDPSTVETANDLFKADDVSLDGVSTMLLSMEVPAEENWKLIRRAHEKGIKTILNLAPYHDVPEDILSKLDYLIVNEGEMQDLCERPHDDDDFELMIGETISRYKNLTVIVTLGGEGCMIGSQKGLAHYPAPKVNVVDSVGAGDAFCGAFAAALEAGLPLIEALKRALHAGSEACTAFGAQAGHADSAKLDTLTNRFA